MNELRRIITQLAKTRDVDDKDLFVLLTNDQEDNFLYEEADKIRRSIYKDAVYIRGLIEFTNYCKNNCYYCGIRCENKLANRYRLSKEDILECADEGYELGFRTFVLQGGEDPYFQDEIMVDIIASIKNRHPDCAITLSMGEKSKDTYKAFFEAGADRYLLRHETAEEEHYKKLHPENMSLDTRIQCLFDLKEIGYQTGSGFMVGSPYQTTENIIKDLRFLQKLQPDMVGIGPFITHKNTPFKDFESGSVKLTLKLISVLRLMFPKLLIPATTALGTLHPNGRELGLKAGANVVMPNLSPKSTRKLYEIYENKLSTNEEAAESLSALKIKVKSVGYEVVIDRGDRAK